MAVQARELAMTLAPAEVEEDTQHVVEYAPDISDKLFRNETGYMVRPSYVECQKDITGKMRAILIDWLVEVHMKYKLRPETLFLTVHLLDRYLSRVAVTRKRVQLVGVVALCIAAKFEEITPPEVHDYIYITDNAYTKEAIMTMECRMLAALDFQVVAPTVIHFLGPLLLANHCTEMHAEVVRYLLELTLLDLQALQYAPSELVAAATMLSNELLGRDDAWPATVAKAARHSEADLRSCAEYLRGLLAGAPQHSLQAVQMKYASHKHHAISKPGGVVGPPTEASAGPRRSDCPRSSLR